jgi:uncharacterized protein YjbI with pentapeptide repeats
MKSSTLMTTALVTVLGISLPAYAENLEHSRQLLATKQCPRCDLSRSGFVFADLSGANLSQANLVGANLSQSNLQGADLRGANLAGASLNGANLTGARLDGANLAGADLRKSYLTGASVVGTITEGAYLQGAIGLAASVGTIDDFYRWALEDEQRQNYVSAIQNYTQVIARKAEFAPAYLGRSAARMRTGDRKQAIADAREAERLFKAQGDSANAEAATKIAILFETPISDDKIDKGKPNFGQALIGILGSAMQLFLSRFSLPSLF